MHPEKYVGDPTNVIYRSGMELQVFRYMDINRNVRKWSSETVTVPYFDESTNKNRTYFVDLYFEFVSPSGQVKRAIVEVKPHKQTLPPVKKGRKDYYQKAMCEYKKNCCKWKSARAYAARNGMEFFILTEREIG